MLKHKLAKITNPTYKADAWKKIYSDYVKETGEKIEQKKLTKRWHNEIGKLQKHQREFIADIQRTGT